MDLIKDLQAKLIAQAETNYNTLMTGYTHLQVAQPITFGHQLLAYVEMFGRDKTRLQDCKKELHSLLQEERLLGATLLVFANKQDLQGALTVEEIKNTLELDNIKTHHWQIINCSAVTGENLLNGMDWLLQDISARIFTLD